MLSLYTLCSLHFRATSQILVTWTCPMWGLVNFVQAKNYARPLNCFNCTLVFRWLVLLTMKQCRWWLCQGVECQTAVGLIGLRGEKDMPSRALFGAKRCVWISFFNPHVSSVPSSNIAFAHFFTFFHVHKHAISKCWTATGTNLVLERKSII